MDENEVENTADEVAEKTLTQSQVDRIVKREKAAVAERVRREMEQQQTQQVQQQAPAQPEVDMDALIAEKVREAQDKAREEYEAQQLKAQQEAYDRELQEIGHRYKTKVAVGPSKYADFNEVMEQGFDINAFAPLALAVTDYDNTVDLVYALAQDPVKAAQINNLLQTSYKVGVNQLQKFADSVTKNIDALSQEPDTPAPLDRPKSSSVAGTDNGNLSVADYRKMPFLRG